jgi:hypothetical protein
MASPQLPAVLGPSSPTDVHLDDDGLPGATRRMLQCAPWVCPLPQPPPLPPRDASLYMLAALRPRSVVLISQLKNTVS